MNSPGKEFCNFHTFNKSVHRVESPQQIARGNFFHNYFMHWFQPGKGRLRADLIAAFQYLKEAC